MSIFTYLNSHPPFQGRQQDSILPQDIAVCRGRRSRLKPFSILAENSRQKETKITAAGPTFRNQNTPTSRLPLRHRDPNLLTFPPNPTSSAALTSSQDPSPSHVNMVPRSALRPRTNRMADNEDQDGGSKGSPKATAAVNNGWAPQDLESVPALFLASTCANFSQSPSIWTIR
jgi:hypothetical protein